MEESIQKWSFDAYPNNEKLSTSNDESSLNETKSKTYENQKKVNSWDCSIPSDKDKTPKKITNDWDSTSSECQETMVEPFDNEENPKDPDNWDSESEKNDKVSQGKGAAPYLFSSLDSYDLSIGDLSDVDKSSLVDSYDGRRGKKTHEEDSLLVEDFEEYAVREENFATKTEDKPKTPCTDPSNPSEGTPEDTTIWMIPNSERTRSGDSTSKLISSSGREKIEKCIKFRHFLRKTKSLPGVEKRKITRKTRSSRSEHLVSNKSNCSSFFLVEGSDHQRKLEIEPKKPKEIISGCESFDRTRVFFTEYECRAMTMEKETPDKLSASSRVVPNTSEDTLQEGSDENRTRRPTEEATEGMQPGTSGVASFDYGGLPDMADGSSSDDPKAKGPTTKMPVGTQMSESWLLLDDAGNYQTISRNEVSILLNGRSADAVLQGKKEHFIPKSSLKDTASLRNSLTNVATKESLQNFLKEEDVGGEDDRKKMIDLERKMENTLFFIQPGMSLTASIRVIPVDTEMIHVWKRARDGGSVLSSEIDLLDSSPEPMEPAVPRTFPDHHSSSFRRQIQDRTAAQEETATQTPCPAAENRIRERVSPESQSTQAPDYSRLLIETRSIVDSLTNNFKALQNRLDGETSRSMALQGEISKLRLLVKNYGGKHSDRNSRETIFDTQPSMSDSPSLLTLKASDKTDIVSESIAEEESRVEPSKVDIKMHDESTSMDILNPSTALQVSEEPKRVCEENDIITVNIYAVESITPITNFGKIQEPYSIVQANLGLIEKKMKRLQQENEVVTIQNVELRKKLKEISLELEKYLASTSEQDTCIEEGKELETLRDQVCNLKLELENLKTMSRSQDKKLTEENSLIREELAKSILFLNDWLVLATRVFEELQNATSKLQEIGITIDVTFKPESTTDPKILSELVICYVEKTCRCLFSLKDENILYEQMVQDSGKATNTQEEISGLGQMISGYSDLIDQCQKDDTGVVEDYFAVIMEKASLAEEVKVLKTEKEMLLESQTEHHEKLKQTMVALKDSKNEITALQSSQKLSEEERKKMAEVLKVYERENKKLEEEILEKNKTAETLIEELREKDFEISDWNERLKAAVSEIKNFEKSSRLKDELINELKTESDELFTADGMKNDQIQILKDEIKNLELQRSQLEAEVESTKLFLSESQKETTDYITHLEALVSNSQDSLDKMKQKLKENSQTISRLKNDYEVLEKQYQCDVKLFKNTKDELHSCKEKILQGNKELKESEEDREKLHKKCECLTSSEKEKSEALEILAKEYKAILTEKQELKGKLEIHSKDKDELLKEQKDLINKYAILSREIQKLQDKYRSVKTECNERSDLIRYLEHMLKENLVEYNNRIVCLEQNISRIIEKIIACKNGMREKHCGIDAEVRELRHQLSVTYQERKDLEHIANNYYSLMKRLENEVEERERRVDELSVKLSMEQQKAVEHENGKRSVNTLERARTEENSKIEQLRSQIAATENDLVECRKELHNCQTSYENERKKFELTIADLKSEIKRYQLRIEVMMRNLSNCNKNTNSLITDKRSTEDSEIREKNKKISELTEAVSKYKAEISVRDSDLENLKQKAFYKEEELKNLQNQMEKLRDVMSATNKENEIRQKERDEMAEKLLQSIKLIMEERSTRQTLESLLVEKEKNYRNQIDQIKTELELKIKEYQTVSEALESKQKLVNKIQDDLRKLKGEMIGLKSQVSSYKKKSGYNGNSGNGDGRKGEAPFPHAATSLEIHVKSPNVSPERLESCLRELKEIRDLNLELRRTEGQYQAKIVRLEDEIRDARLLIKELQGDIKTEKKSKKAFKNMIIAAKMEVEKCLLGKQLMSVVAERIARHLDLSEIPSRELLSGFRLSHSSGSSNTCV